MIGSSTRKDEVLERLSNGIAQLTSSVAWRDWLAIQSRFHRCSFSNTLLILVQRCSASRVAGFHTWRRLGRQVRRGEQAIWILAPVTRRVAADDAIGEAEEAIRVVATFRPVPVFDVTQTEGEPLPEVCTRLAGDDPLAAYVGPTGLAGSIGFQVLDHTFDGETNGDCSHPLQRIRVEVNLEPAHRVKTLAHELAHAVLHVDTTDRALKELEAESVAYVVCDALGIQSDGWTFGYVAGWAGGGDEAIAAIKAVGARIQRTADRILSGRCAQVSLRADRDGFDRAPCPRCDDLASLAKGDAVAREGELAGLHVTVERHPGHHPGGVLDACHLDRGVAITKKADRALVKVNRAPARHKHVHEHTLKHIDL